MPDLTTRAVEIPAEINNFYSRELLERAVPLFVHTSFAQVRDIPRNYGTDTIKFRKYGALTAQTTPLTEGVTPAGKQLSTTDITAEVEWYGDFITLTDEVLIESIDPILVEAAEVLGEQLADSLDQLCRDIVAAGTTVQYASTATSTGTVTSAMLMTRAEVKEMVLTLKNNDAKPLTSRIDPNTGYNTVPLNRCFVMIATPSTVHDLSDATGWVPLEKYPNKGDIMPGEQGSVGGVRVIETTNAKVKTGEGSGSIDVHCSLVLAKNAYGISRISGEAVRNIVKPLGSGGSTDPLDQRGTSGWKASFVAKILQQTYMGRIEHAVSL